MNIAGHNEMAPKGLGARARRGRQLAHQRPPRGTAHKNRAAKAGVDGGGIPCGESGGTRRALVPDEDDDSNSRKCYENSEKNGKG